MLANQKYCDQHQLQLLLEDRLSPTGRSKLTEHLDRCTNCCNRLEELAARKSWWVDACENLSSTEIDRHQIAELATVPPVIRETNNESIEADSNDSDVKFDFLEPSDEPGVIGTLGDYQILELVGKGGMGIVLKGFDPELDRFVAIKILAPHFASSGAARQRFARESRAAAAIVHPNVVAIFGVDANGPIPYLVMPYIPGESLQDKIDREGALDVQDILRIAKQCADGLAAAHAQGLVHRDIKPANILLEMKVDRVLITDFGLARAADDAALTHSGMLAGTPPYMSPEQANGESIDHRSDLFSLGSVIYTMATGKTPFRASNTVAILRKIADKPVPPIRDSNPGIPKWLVTIVKKLHAKNPKDRFHSASELASLLEKCLAHTHHPDRIPLPKSLRQRTSWKRWACISIGTMLATFLVIVLSDQWRSWSSNRPIAADERNNTQSMTETTIEVGTASANNADGSTSWHMDEIDSQLQHIESQIKELESNSKPSTSFLEERK